MIKNVRTVIFSNFYHNSGNLNGKQKIWFEKQQQLFTSSLLVTLPIHLSSTDVLFTPVLLESGEILRSLWKHYKLKIESYMHFQMIYFSC